MTTNPSVLRRARFAAIVVLLLLSQAAAPVLGLVQPARGLEAQAVPSGGRDLVSAVGPTGTVWAVWVVDDGHDTELVYSVWHEGDWSSPQLVHSRPDAWDHGPSLVIAADGSVWLAWVSSQHTSPHRGSLWLSTWLDGAWSEPEPVSGAGGGSIWDPSLAAAPDGSLWLAWVSGQDEIYASQRMGETWTLGRQVSLRKRCEGCYNRQPQLAAGQSSVWLVWTGHQDGVDDEIFASRWTGSAWTRAEMVSQDDQALDVSPSLALDALGQPWVAWEGRLRADDGSRRRILVSHWESHDEEWSAEELASMSLSFSGDAGRPALSSDTAGHLRLAWQVATPFDRVTAWSERRGTGWSAPRLVAGHEMRSLTWVGERVVGLSVSSHQQPPLAMYSPTDGDPVLAQLHTSRIAPNAEDGIPFIPNRYLAFGDSITFGQYAGEGYSYPEQLEGQLDLRVADSDVINAGNPGEKTYGGSERITGQVTDNQPQYVLIMEGTNNVTAEDPPSKVYDQLLDILDNALVTAGVDGVQVMLATLVPRLDYLNTATAEMNQLAVIPAANARGVPICDQWQAFYDYGPWDYFLYRDDKHPNAAGLQLVADTFYDCMLASFPTFVEETTPPDAWIESAPASVECSSRVAVSWSGADDLSWVVDYDVQVLEPGGVWTDWLQGTTHASSYYNGTQQGVYGDAYGFRVRARDLVGNLGAYSSAEYTLIGDTEPPYQAYVDPLPATQVPPFAVHWGGLDACAEVNAYDVQYRVGSTGIWQDWKLSTALDTELFDPASPEYGETYYFRARAQDAAGNWMPTWSDEVQTVLARYRIEGNAYAIDHAPIAAAEVVLDPAPLALEAQGGGGFLAYMPDGGAVDVTVSRTDRYGALPAMAGVAVGEDLQGLTFVLPPQDDLVKNGGLEEGNLNGWERGGTLAPAWSTEAHTGLGAVELGAEGQFSWMQQILTPTMALDLGTLSLLVRIKEGSGPGTLTFSLWGGGAEEEQTVGVDDTSWSHVWLSLPELDAEPMTLTLTVSDSVTLVVDEVSLGTAATGYYPTHLPLVIRAY